jgi:4-hydroxybutyryl-CoA dehydratase / vinylacetyl-CoA-Delta-isomerase
MTIRTAQQYRDGLRDGRRVFYRGRAAADVTAEPELAPACSSGTSCGAGDLRR